MITRVAWRNLWRRRQRTLFTSLAMGIGVGLAMGMMALQSGIFSEVFDEMVTDSLGHVQLHHPDYPSTRHLHDTLRQSRALIAQSEALTEVTRRRAASLHRSARGWKSSIGRRADHGSRPEREVELSEIDQEVTQGRWLHPLNAVRWYSGSS